LCAPDRYKKELIILDYCQYLEFFGAALSRQIVARIQDVNRNARVVAAQ